MRNLLEQLALNRAILAIEGLSNRRFRLGASKVPRGSGTVISRLPQASDGGGRGHALGRFGRTWTSQQSGAGQIFDPGNQKAAINPNSQRNIQTDHQNTDKQACSFHVTPAVSLLVQCL